MPFIIKELGKDISSLIWKRLNPLDKFVVLASKKYADEKFMEKIIGKRGMNNFIKEISKNGYLELAKWAKEMGCPLNEWAYIHAVRIGNLDFLEWLKKNDCPCNNYYIFEYGMKGENMDVLNWLKRNDFPLYYSTFNTAIETGNIKILDWIYENYPELVSKSLNKHSLRCRAAARGGRLEALKWLRSKGWPWDEEVCSDAAEGGHLEVLKWLRENGCPWDKWTCIHSANKRHLEVLKWAITNGCPPGNLTDYNIYPGFLETMGVVVVEDLLNIL